MLDSPASLTLSSSGLGHSPFTGVTRVRIPLGSPLPKVVLSTLKADNVKASRSCSALERLEAAMGLYHRPGLLPVNLLFG